MWIPKNESEIVNAVGSKSFQETVTFDAKKEIPSKNVETAKDVSAMANTSGGVLIYGIDEDENGFPTVLNPISLAGQSEKIESIVRTSIDEVPVFKLSVIPTETDESKGYLIVFVPPSERAPHMVIVKGERRYYGRGETGNYPLSHSEIAGLYERRRATGNSILPLLEDFIKNSPITEHNGFSHLFIIARPVLQEKNTLLSAARKISENNDVEITIPDMLSRQIRAVTGNEIYRSSYSPNFRDPYNWTRRPQGFYGMMDYTNSETSSPNSRALYIQINFDGSANLFCGRAAETNNRSGEDKKWFFPQLVAGNTVRFLSLLGNIYEDAGYLGMIDIGVGLTNLENSVAYGVDWIFHDEAHFYDASDYRETTRVSAMLLKENPKRVAAELVMPLIDAVSQGRSNPFQ